MHMAYTINGLLERVIGSSPVAWIEDCAYRLRPDYCNGIPEDTGPEISFILKFLASIN
jgi:hypothetical protein